MSDSSEAVRTYHALRFGNVYVTCARHAWPLSPRLDVRNHSSTGFSWGRPTPGARQLALAILIDHFGRGDAAVTAAIPLYEQFMVDVIARQDRYAPFELTSEQIDAWHAWHAQTRITRAAEEA